MPLVGYCVIVCLQSSHVFFVVFCLPWLFFELHCSVKNIFFPIHFMNDYKARLLSSDGSDLSVPNSDVMMERFLAYMRWQNRLSAQKALFCSQSSHTVSNGLFLREFTSPPFRKTSGLPLSCSALTLRLHWTWLLLFRLTNNRLLNDGDVWGCSISNLRPSLTLAA